ncbi:6-phosphogluconolactonase [Bartonella sp. DGB2]|uniref:6-phosphogluconolactonase n=1 Tax=Bartonella sp. DGB2 TaxID=3388426 RepID=UPI00398FDED1
MDALNFEQLNFDIPTALASALADRVATELSIALVERQTVVLAVSGGQTPKAFFHQLSKADIDWRNVIITLVDERFVPPTHERSNEGLVRMHLLQHFAAKARFVGLYQPAITADLAAFSAANRIDALPKPFDVVVLGMGNDGHTASFFADSVRLGQALDLETRALVLPIHAKSAGEARLTLTLPVICQASFIALQIEGYDKLKVLERVLKGVSAYDMPVAAVLDNAQQPVQIYWSPREGEYYAPEDAGHLPPHL